MGGRDDTPLKNLTNKPKNIKRIGSAETQDIQEQPSAKYITYILLTYYLLPTIRIKTSPLHIKLLQRFFSPLILSFMIKFYKTNNVI